MKIALFSDVHANLPALEAVLTDIDNRQPDAVYCLGDLVGYNIWPTRSSIQSAKGASLRLLATTITALAAPATTAAAPTGKRMRRQWVKSP